MKYLSRESSIETVKKLFKNAKIDTISLTEAYTAWGRDLTKKVENRSWITNKLTHLRHNRLVLPAYSVRNSKRLLTHVKLTREGQAALSESNGSPLRKPETGEQRKITLEDIMREIPRLQEENKKFKITFSVTPREG